MSLALVAIMMQSMVIQMNDQHLQTLAQLQAFLDGTAVVDFTLAPSERYGFIPVNRQIERRSQFHDPDLLTNK